jgi:hypothetical protein
MPSKLQAFVAPENVNPRYLAGLIGERSGIELFFLGRVSLLF